MVFDPIPQSLPVHSFGSLPQPPTSPLFNKHMFSGPISMEQRANIVVSFRALFNRNRALFMIHRALFNRFVALFNKHMFSGPICMEQRANTVVSFRALFVKYTARFRRCRALCMIHRAL